MTYPSLDVMILTYNRASLFKEALISVCNQTYQNFTIKVFNNGSTDNTREVYEEVKNLYPNRRIEYLELAENHLDDYLGQKMNEFLTADYCAVFHDDDLVHPNYIEYAMKVIEKNPEIVLLGCKTKITTCPEKLKWNKPTLNYEIGTVKDIVRWEYVGDTFSFPSIIYKCEYYKTTKFDNKMYGNRGDIPFLLSIAEKGLACCLETRFFHYRISKSQNATKLPTVQQRTNLVKLFADYLLSGDEKDKQVFYERMRFYALKYPYLPYHVLKENNWITPKARIDVFLLNLLWLFKVYLYKFMEKLSFGRAKQKYKAKKEKYVELLQAKKEFIPYPPLTTRNVVLISNDIKRKTLISGSDNIIDTNAIKCLENLEISIEINGSDNYIFLENLDIKNNISININGNNNFVEITDSLISNNFEIKPQEVISNKTIKYQNNEFVSI